VNYATASWVLHAEKAETRGVSQAYLLLVDQQYPKFLERCVWLCRVVKYSISHGREPYDAFYGREPGENSNMLHIASSSNLLTVVEGLLLIYPMILKNRMLLGIEHFTTHLVGPCKDSGGTT
jgi:hypothetical protein